MHNTLIAFFQGFIFFAGFVTGAAVFVKLREREGPKAKEDRERLNRIAAAHEKAAANLFRVANVMEYFLSDRRASIQRIADRIREFKDRKGGPKA